MSFIKEVWVGPVENHLNDNTDVTVTLGDGRVFSFTAFTPLNLMSLMDRERVAYVLSEDMVVLREITETNVRAAVEEMLEDENIERFGILADHS